MSMYRSQIELLNQELKSQGQAEESEYKKKFNNVNRMLQESLKQLEKKDEQLSNLEEEIVSLKEILNKANKEARQSGR